MPPRSVLLLAAVSLCLTAAAPFRPNTDRSGDSLPPGALARLGTLRLPKGEGALSADGKLLVTADAADGVRCWDAPSGKVVRSIGWGTGGARAAALSADGKLLALGDGRFPVRVVDLAKQQELRRYGAAERVTALAFSPDGRTLAAAGDRVVRLYDVATGEPRGRLDGTPPVRSLALSADGKTLTVTDHDGLVRVLGTGDGKERSSLDLRADKKRLGSFWASADGKSFVGNAGDRTVRVWDAKGREQLRLRDDPAGALTAAAFSGDGKRLATAGGPERFVRLWDAESGELVRRLQGLDVFGVVWLAFSPDGKVVLSLSFDGRLRRWGADSGESLGPPDGVVTGGQRLALSADGKTLCTAGTDGGVRVWDVAAGRLKRTLIASGPYPQALALSADGKRLATRCVRQDVRVWDVGSGKELRGLPAARLAGVSVVFSPDGEMAATGGTAPQLWQAETGRERARLSREVGPANALFTPDGKSLVTLGFDGKIAVWSTDSGKEQRALAGLPACFEGAFSPDGKLLALRPTLEESFLVVDFHKGKLLRRVAVRPGPRRLEFLKDGKLVTWGYFGPRVWDTGTGKELTPDRGHGGPVAAGTFRGEREVVTVGVDGALRFWEPATGRQVRKVELPAGAGTPSQLSAALTPGGKLLALPSRDNSSFYLYDGETGKLLRRTASAKGLLPVVSLSPDGKRLAWQSVFPARVQKVVDVASGEEKLSLKDATWLWVVPGRDWALSVQQTTNSIRFWDLKTGKERHVIKGHPALSVQAVAFSDDGSMMAAGGALGMVRVFELASGSERFRFRTGSAAGSSIHCLGFSPGGRLLATGGSDGAVTLWQAAAPDDSTKAPANPLFTLPGNAARHLAGHAGAVNTLAFSPSGKLLLTTSDDSTALVWDAARPAPKEQAKPAPKEQDRLWEELASDVAAVAYRALCRLADGPAWSLPLLRQRLEKPPAVDAKEVYRLVFQLKDDKKHEDAAAALWRLGKRAEATLEEALEGKPTLAQRERIMSVLDRIKGPVPPPDQLRVLRAVEAVERAGGAEAARALNALAKSKDADLAEAARSALTRVEH